MKKVWMAAMVLGLSGLCMTGWAQQQSWSSWVQTLRQEAIAKGIRPGVFDRAFANVRPK